MHVEHRQAIYIFIIVAAAYRVLHSKRIFQFTVSRPKTTIHLCTMQFTTTSYHNAFVWSSTLLSNLHLMQCDYNIIIQKAIASFPGHSHLFNVARSIRES